MKNLRKWLLLPALVLPLTAGTCTSDKVVEFVIGTPTTVEFLATGSVNTYDDTNTVNVKEDLDLENALDDADLDVNDVEEIQLVQVFYRVTVPEAGRSITNGALEFTRLGAADPGPHLVVSGFTADMSAATDWIDLTTDLQPGLTQVNDFLEECLAELKGTGPPVTAGTFEYHVSGNSIPASVPTNFQWEVKLVIQVVATRELEVPFGA